MFPNSRNAAYPKTVATEIGGVELAVPRDRGGTFTPMLLPKASVGFMASTPSSSRSTPAG